MERRCVDSLVVWIDNALRRQLIDDDFRLAHNARRRRRRLFACDVDRDEGFHVSPPVASDPVQPGWQKL
jgi:hypothetical protein